MAGNNVVRERNKPLYAELEAWRRNGQRERLVDMAKRLGVTKGRLMGVANRMGLCTPKIKPGESARTAPAFREPSPPRRFRRRADDENFATRHRAD